MAWSDLPTNYTDVAWSGRKKYTQIDNSDGSVSFDDITEYTNKENSFFGASDANKMNEAINSLMGGDTLNSLIVTGMSDLTIDALSDDITTYGLLKTIVSAINGLYKKATYEYEFNPYKSGDANNWLKVQLTRIGNMVDCTITGTCTIPSTGNSGFSELTIPEQYRPKYKIQESTEGLGGNDAKGSFTYEIYTDGKLGYRGNENTSSRMEINAHTCWFTEQPWAE